MARWRARTHARPGRWTAFLEMIHDIQVEATFPRWHQKLVTVHKSDTLRGRDNEKDPSYRGAVNESALASPRIRSCRRRLDRIVCRRRRASARRPRPHDGDGRGRPVGRAQGRTCSVGVAMRFCRRDADRRRVRHDARAGAVRGAGHSRIGGGAGLAGGAGRRSAGLARRRRGRRVRAAAWPCPRLGSCRECRRHRIHGWFRTRDRDAASRRHRLCAGDGARGAASGHPRSPALSAWRLAPVFMSESLS